LGGRVLFHFATTGQVSPYVPSAMAAGFLIIFAVQVIALGVLAGLVVSNRKLLEDTLFRLKSSAIGTGRGRVDSEPAKVLAGPGSSKAPSKTRKAA
jgi:hypothetical protein